ncbi:UPF0149 family protein [Burkholderia cenocepacia]|uniref:YecA/YgfB family protein n=1 Tax=Burkholderia cepacia complex TaxID=87882 RepID=UPI00158A4884|nr:MULTISPECIES: YecA family protein [Burkholderia cepacia complex]MBR8028567.1 UPF0149 family protein [Burkholderia cenocepacia]MBR8167872.1 UPF0149 family protein [Burkholderia cenocepacia]MDN7902463.1 UPF0149 family protein [Burkholderia cepacia]
MNNLTSQQPLTDDDFARLSGFLDSIGDAAMNIETLDGYFVALICGPDIVLPSEYLPQIWGEDFSFESDGQATEIIELLMRHWNTISTELQQTLHEPNVYLPVLLEREDGVAPANDWANGFMRGVQMRPASWGELIHDEDHGGPMLPIMMLHHEHNPDSQMRPPPIPAEKREELLQTMIAGLTHIYRYFEPHRRALASIPARVPMRREEQKIGRNEPCPCGSGRKYKHCCMASSPTFH